MKIMSLILAACLTGCVCESIPMGVTPVSSFDGARYSGKWYEIARLDHFFEKGMSKVTAEYTANPDGSFKVVNRGFVEKNNEWKEITGRAVFVDKSNQGHLNVSFFGPFYGGYIVFDLDPNYQHALVSGPDHSNFWLLSRTPTISDDVKADLMKKIQAAGFDTSKLVMVQQ